MKENVLTRMDNASTREENVVTREENASTRIDNELTRGENMPTEEEHEATNAGNVSTREVNALTNDKLAYTSQFFSMPVEVVKNFRAFPVLNRTFFEWIVINLGAGKVTHILWLNF